MKKIFRIFFALFVVIITSANVYAKEGNLDVEAYYETKDNKTYVDVEVENNTGLMLSDLKINSDIEDPYMLKDITENPKDTLEKGAKEIRHYELTAKPTSKKVEAKANEAKKASKAPKTGVKGPTAIIIILIVAIVVLLLLNKNKKNKALALALIMLLPQIMPNEAKASSNDINQKDQFELEIDNKKVKLEVTVTAKNNETEINVGEAKPIPNDDSNKKPNENEASSDNKKPENPSKEEPSKEEPSKEEPSENEDSNKPSTENPSKDDKNSNYTSSKEDQQPIIKEDNETKDRKQRLLILEDVDKKELDKLDKEAIDKIYEKAKEISTEKGYWNIDTIAGKLITKDEDFLKDMTKAKEGEFDKYNFIRDKYKQENGESIYKDIDDKKIEDILMSGFDQIIHKNVSMDEYLAYKLKEEGIDNKEFDFEKIKENLDKKIDLDKKDAFKDKREEFGENAKDLDNSTMLYLIKKQKMNEFYEKEFDIEKEIQRIK